MMHSTNPRLTDEARPTRAQSIVTVPIDRPAYVLSDDPDDEPIGPFPCVAIATFTTLESVGGVVVDRRNFPTSDYEVEYLNDDLLESAPSYFLILPDNPTEWDGLWIEQKNIAFSATAAHEARVQRRALLARREELAP